MADQRTDIDVTEWRNSFAGLFRLSALENISTAFTHRSCSTMATIM